jgi:hypothetical protein
MASASVSLEARASLSFTEVEKVEKEMVRRGAADGGAS